MTAVEEPSVATASHPLEPLTAEEIAAAARLLQTERNLGPTARFVFITLREPTKADLLGGTRTPLRCRARRTSSCTSAASGSPTMPSSR